MKRSRYHILFFFLMPWSSLIAQPDSTFSLTRTIKAEIVDFAVDNLGNLYTLSSDNRLKKISPAGDSLAVYNDVRRYGNISHMDVTNPLKIILYYKEFATIVMVDRFLNVINSIDLRKINIFQARAVGLAYDNNVWVYDELEAKLKKISDDGTLINQTTDVRQFLDAAPDPVSVTDQSGLVYLYDPQKGVFIFDHYGAFQKQIPLPGILDFDVIDKNLLARNSQYFLRFSPGNLNIQQFPIPTAYLPAIKITIMPNAVYVLKQTGLEIYSKK
jgi:hypothetical protein